MCEMMCESGMKWKHIHEFITTTMNIRSKNGKNAVTRRKSTAAVSRDRMAESPDVLEVPSIREFLVGSLPSRGELIRSIKKR